MCDLGNVGNEQLLFVDNPSELDAFFNSNVYNSAIEYLGNKQWTSLKNLVYNRKGR